jgi:protease-4
MKDLIHSILNIFHHAGRIISLIRNTIVNTVFLLIIAFIAIGFFTSDTPEIKNNSILRLTLSGDIVEQRRPSAPFETVVEELLGMEPEPQQLVLQDILDIVQTASKDPAISTILLDLHDLGNVGLNQMQSIGKSLTLFRQQDKKVIAAEDFYTQKQYYLASYADTIIINPMGGVELHGFGVYPLYYKEALEKLQVNYHVFRVGTYKSAIEPIIRDSMSDEVREQNGEWLNALWLNYTSDVTGQRGLPADAISKYIENIDVKLEALNGDTAKLALENHLVDKLLTREEIENYLNSLSAGSSYSAVSTEEYFAKIKPTLHETEVDNNAIGIIVAEGTILDGQQPAGFIGSESLGDRIRSARNNNAIKGVVLRINSGGGSAFASEIIRQELLELKKTGKPLVVSMGAMAASGGYWIAADADQIWASPTTITGSIGIFGAIPTFERTLDQLGIHSDGVGTTSLSAGMNLTQPLTPAMKQSIQLTVDNGYARFLSIVENGRKIAKDRLSTIAEGRVFSGEKAKELNLVDNLGSLDDAVQATAKLAGLDKHSVIYLEQKGSMRDQILQSLRITAASFFPDIFASSTPLHNMYQQIRKGITDFLLIDDPNNIYAHSMLQLSL